jgi:hypothetical protein
MRWRAILICVIVGWIVGVGILGITMELTDGEVFDSTWFSS